MVIDELNIRPEYRLSRVLKVLEAIYGINLDFASVKTRSNLVSVYEKYDIIRKRIIREAPYNSYNQNSEYTKSWLIQEAIGLFLNMRRGKRVAREQR